jgi:16S rRNA (guanine1207-N2)-methyltransferase
VLYTLISTEIKGITLEMKTENELFSPKNVDKGTLAMLSVIDFEKDDKVLDLGCGYGVVGILAAKLIGSDSVTMVDIDEKAVRTAIENANINGVPSVKIGVSDGFGQVDEIGFTKIISHPPYHVDFSVPKMFIEKGFNRMAIGGKMFMVTKRKEWYENKLTAIFGGVRIWEIDDYFVFMATKKTTTYANVKIKDKSKNNTSETNKSKKRNKTKK